MKDLNGNEYFTKEKVNEIICEKFKDLDIFTKEQGTEIIKIEHEYFKGLNYVYIEYTNKNWSMKRYGKLVYSYAFTFLEFKDSNVLDFNQSYNISDIKSQFKNKLIYLLSKTI
jgi:hypothetical protein